MTTTRRPEGWISSIRAETTGSGTGTGANRSGRDAVTIEDGGQTGAAGPDRRLGTPRPGRGSET